MKTKILSLILFLFAGITAFAAEPVKAKEISEKEFTQLVSEYRTGINNWKFKGTKPAVVDFYASWCGPCRKVSPIIDELAKEYAGKVDFYKVNVDNAQELSKALGVSSIPMILFVPVKGDPQAITGAYPKEELINAMNYVFFNKK